MDIRYRPFIATKVLPDGTMINPNGLATEVLGMCDSRRPAEGADSAPKECENCGHPIRYSHHGFMRTMIGDCFGCIDCAPDLISTDPDDDSDLIIHAKQNSYEAEAPSRQGY